jgi:predicted O-methyltransferase YrrM
MRKYLRAAANFSLARLFYFLAEPWRIPVAFTRPRPQPPAEAARALFPELTPAAIEAYRLEFLGNGAFFAEFNKAFLPRRHRRVNNPGWDEFLYLAVRVAQPKTMVETGVFDGYSSAVILQALRDNGVGRLISIDLPATDTIDMSTHLMPESTLPPGCQPGWAIPDYLRDRHRLILGDSKKVLPSLLAEHSTIDIFFHDSLHTFEHMYFEYSTAWPKLRDGGLLFSDDISWSAAFHKFCRQVGKPYVYVPDFGATRK